MSWKLLLVGLGLLIVIAGAVAVIRLRHSVTSPPPQAIAPPPPIPAVPKSAPPASPIPNAPAPGTSVPPGEPIDPGTIELVDAHLKGWIDSWTAVAPEFDIRRFRKVSEGKIREESSPLDTRRLEENRRPLYVFSPDNARFVDPYGGMEVVTENGRPAALFDVDRSVTLYDPRTARAVRLAFCGTACTIEDAVWLSNDFIAVVGRSEEGSCGATAQPCPWGPMLIVFDLLRNTELIYVGPSMDSSRRQYFETQLRQRLPGINFP